MSAGRQRHRLTWCAGLILLMFCLAVFSRAQGCTQCRDNTAATPLATQHAYRNAIMLLAGAAIGIGSTVLFVGRKFR